MRSPFPFPRNELADFARGASTFAEGIGQRSAEHSHNPRRRAIRHNTAKLTLVIARPSLATSTSPD